MHTFKITRNIPFCWSCVSWVKSLAHYSIKVKRSLWRIATCKHGHWCIDPEHSDGITVSFWPNAELIAIIMPCKNVMEPLNFVFRRLAINQWWLCFLFNSLPTPDVQLMRSHQLVSCVIASPCNLHRSNIAIPRALLLTLFAVRT